MRSNMMFYKSEFHRGNRNVLSWSKVGHCRRLSFLKRFDLCWYHFAILLNIQMAWWNNIDLGCAVQNCGTFYFTVCMYRPGYVNLARMKCEDNTMVIFSGNFVNQHVYQVGAVCSGCPRGNCDGQALCRW